MKRADSRIQKPSLRLDKSPKTKPKAKPKYISKNPKPMGNKGLFPGLLGGKK